MVNTQFFNNNIYFLQIRFYEFFHLSKIKYEMIISEVNRKNVHHIVILECPSTYMGNPSQKTHNSLNDTVSTNICKTVSYAYDKFNELSF